MNKVIDVTELKEEDRKFLEELIVFFKNKQQFLGDKVKGKKIEFGSYDLGKTGKLTREEIYEDL